MDRFAESHRKQHHAHVHQYRVSPYRKFRPSSRPAVVSAPSPVSVRSHAKSNRRVKLDIGALNKEDETLVNDSTLEKQSEPDSDDPIFHWDETATLLSDLMDEKTQDDDDEGLEQLIESLQPPFTAQGHRKKKEIAEVLVGTHNRVKNVFKLLDGNVDAHYGKGAHLFNSGSMAIEETFFAQQIDFQEANNAAESKIEELLAELEEDFALRDRLWVDLENQMNSLLLPAIEKIKNTPEQVERTILKLEKHSKALEYTGKEATTSARKIVDELMKKA